MVLYNAHFTHTLNFVWDFGVYACNFLPNSYTVSECSNWSDSLTEGKS